MRRRIHCVDREVRNPMAQRALLDVVREPCLAYPA
jgi:hypothetical protein